jgi:hypothetical protein
VKSLLAALASVSLLLLAPVARALDTAEEIRTCLRSNLPQRTSVQTIELSALDRAGGRRNLRAKLHWKRGDDDLHRIRLRVERPTDLRGSSYLVIEKQGEDEMFMYLPATQRVRRVTTAMISDSLWGTDFSYEDVKQMQGITLAGAVRRLEDATVGERPVYVLELESQANVPSAYSKVVSFVDRDTCVALKTEFYEQGAAPRKLLTADPGQLLSENDRWSARELDMRDLQTGTATRLRVLDSRSDADIPDRLFNPTLLGRSR